ncbi:ATP-binding protein [Candidatus Mancarchaeum acidiphilum]|nr:ATP-binding protein [Candidatus Mancarchaeum acidiphilum]
MAAKERFFYRDIEDRIVPFISRDEIIIIRGPRQAGKTTLMKLISDKIKDKKEFVNFDIPSNRSNISESPIDYVRKIADGNKITLFLDEVQRLDNAGEILKIIYDTFKGEVKIFASGSSSLEIRQKVLGFLVGRAIIFDLYTFSFGEFIRSKDTGLYNIFKERNDSLINFIENGEEVLHTAFSEDLLKMWKEYVVYGGYPEVVKADNFDMKKSLLLNLVNLYIEKDIISFFKIEDTKEFENFLRILSFNDSQMLTISNVANDSGLSFYKANSYLEIIENTYIASRVYPYYNNMSSSIKKTPKVYFFDLGLRNAVLDNLLPYEKRDDIGKLAENFVFGELVRLGKKVRYWRTKAGAEMDFVIEYNNEVIPVEVKLGGSKAIGKSFYSFLEVYKPKMALVITLDEFSKKEVNGTLIYYVPIFYL